MTIVLKTCSVCNAEFSAEIDRNHSRARKTCSKKCLHVASSQHFRSRRKIATCKQCGTEFSYKPSDTRQFCSRRCTYKWFSDHPILPKDHPGRLVKLPRTWNSIRRAIIRRDKVCQDCGTDKKLHVHHIDCNQENGVPDNLITLCNNCHAARHVALNQARLSNLILSVNGRRGHSHTCMICGSEFKPRRSESTCSPSCHAEALSRRNRGRSCWKKGVILSSVQVECAYCHKPIQRPRQLTLHRKTIFCSRACHHAWQRHVKHSVTPSEKITIACDNCGNAFTTTAYRLSDYKHHFCSMDCQSRFRQRVPATNT